MKDLEEKWLKVYQARKVVMDAVVKAQFVEVLLGEIECKSLGKREEIQNYPGSW